MAAVYKCCKLACIPQRDTQNNQKEMEMKKRKMKKRKMKRQKNDHKTATNRSTMSKLFIKQ